MYLLLPRLIRWILHELPRQKSIAWAMTVDIVVVCHTYFDYCLYGCSLLSQMFLVANLFITVFISSYRGAMVAQVAHWLAARLTHFGWGSAGFLLSSRWTSKAMLRTAGFQLPTGVHLVSSWSTGPSINWGNLMPLRNSCVQPGNDILVPTGLETVAVFLSWDRPWWSQ